MRQFKFFFTLRSEQARRVSFPPHTISEKYVLVEKEEAEEKAIRDEACQDEMNK